MGFSRVSNDQTALRRSAKTTSARAVVAVCATALVLPFGVGGVLSTGVATAAPTSFTQQAPASGVRVDKVDWLSDRRVALWINSPAMGTTIQVQLLLARDWHTQPSWTFPSLYLLDGLRAKDHENAWTYETDAVQFFQDKNVNVVLPVGGESSFYSDWLEPDKGKNYQWETFLTEELPPILKGEWRVNDTAGIVGLSMGGTAAMFLTARNRGMFQFAASFSGYLNTTSYGMPAAIKASLLDAGGYNADKMWGQPTNPAWDEHDPTQLAKHLKGVSLYMSSATGFQGQFDAPGLIPGIPSNSAGMALEMLAWMSTQNFEAKLKELKIPATVRYTGGGTHTWPYWQTQLHDAWGQIAQALNVDSVGLNTPAANPVSAERTCDVVGQIGELVVGNPSLGACISDERTLRGGARSQEFENGVVYWTSAAGAHLVKGQILDFYEANGGPGGPLGLPTTSEGATAGGDGAFNHFEKGSIYWSPQTGPQMVLNGFKEAWGAAGWEGGPLGYPTGPVTDTADRRGRVQPFQGGAVYTATNLGTVAVLGEIWRKYAELGKEGGYLGWPKGGEQVVGEGRFTEFANGHIYWSAASGPWVMVPGPIGEAWEAEGFESGRLGYPTSDIFDIEGGQRQNFERGHIELKDGVTTVFAN